MSGVSTDLGLTISDSLKWGEPSFKVTGGTPVRLNWTEDKPDKFFLYFNCKTVIIDHLRNQYGPILTLIGNRAVELNLNREVPKEILADCIKMAFQYHSGNSIKMERL